MQSELTLDETNATEAFLMNPTDESYRALFRAISPRIFRYLLLRGCERGVAEDLTQEVMLAVYTQSRHLRDRDLFRPWLFRVARNAWLQHLRQERRRISIADCDADYLSAPMEDPIRTSSFSEWLSWLKPEERELMLLRFVEGLEYHEIASALAIPMGTVQWKIFQLKRRLAARFGVQPA